MAVAPRGLSCVRWLRNHCAIRVDVEQDLFVIRNKLTARFRRKLVAIFGCTVDGLAPKSKPSGGIIDDIKKAFRRAAMIRLAYWAAVLYVAADRRQD